VRWKRVLAAYPAWSRSQRGGYYGFPTMFQPDQLPGVTRDQLLTALQENGVPAAGSGYGLLHELPYFAEGFDIYGGNRGPMGGDYPGYKPGDFPGAGEMHAKLVFLPMLTDPVDGAAEEILRRMTQAVRSL
jgi:hypothetical protein